MLFENRTTICVFYYAVSAAGWWLGANDRKRLCDRKLPAAFRVEHPLIDILARLAMVGPAIR